MSVNGPYALARAARRGLVLRRCVRRALLLASALAVGAALTLTVDWGVRPDAFGRFLLTAFFFGGGAAGAVWAALPLLRPPSELDAAFFVVRELGLSDALPSGVWFAQRGVPSGESEELARICAERSLKEVARTEVALSLSRIELKNGALAAAFCALGWLGFALGLPEEASTGILRLLRPFGGPSWPTRTRVGGVEFDRLAARGEPFEVRMRGAGVLPRSGEVEFVWADGGAEVRAEPSPQLSGLYAAVLPSLPADVRFRAELGDARTSWFRARAVERPRVVSAEVEVSPPEYTGLLRATRAVVGNEVFAPEGSRLVLRFGVSPAPQEAAATVRFAPAEAVDLPVTLDGPRGEVQTTLALDRSGVFTLDVRSSSLGLKPPVRLALRAQKDRPPKVKLLLPRERVLDVLESAEVRLSFEATDDYSVVELSVGGEKRARRVWRGKERTVSHSTVFSPGSFKARPGQVLTVRVKALDARGQTGSGPELVLRVRTRREILRLLELARAEARRRLERLIASLSSDVARGRKPPLRARARSCEELASALDALSASMAMNDVGEGQERSTVKRARSLIHGAGVRLARASSDPRVALEELKRALAEMESWDETRQLVREAERLLAEEIDLMRRTTSGEETAPGQRSLAVRAEKLLARTNEFRRKLEETDPLAAARVREAARAGAPAAPSMRRAWRELERKHRGRALSFQEEAAEALSRMLQALASGTTLDPARAARRLKERAAALRELLRAQEALLAETRARRSPAGELARREARLGALSEEEARKLRELARQAGSLHASDAASELGQAAGRMGSAADYLSRSMMEAASGEERRAVERLRRALESIEKAVSSCALAQARALKKALEALKGEQVRVRRGAEALSGKRALSRADKIRCVELARDETQLETRTRKLAGGMERFPVFAWALNEVRKEMEKVAGRLDEHEPGGEALRAAKRAEEGLDELILSLARAAEAARAGASGAGAGGRGEGGGRLGPSAEELAFMKNRQEKINARADEAASAPEDKRPAAFGDLSLGERRLSRLLERWGRPLPEAAKKEVGRVVGMMGELAGVFESGGEERMKPLGREIVRTLEAWLSSARPARAQMSRAGAAKSASSAEGSASSPMKESVAAPAPGRVAGKGAVVLGEGADWGLLPPSSLEALRRFMAEAFPLEYKDLVKEYFRSLSAAGGE